jgi:hypothetical protein
MDPRLTVSSGGHQVTACVYARCNGSSNSNDSITCGSRAAPVTDLSGFMGCCSTAINPTYDFEHDCSCPGFLCDDDTALVRIKLSNAPSTVACVPYSVTIKF